MRRFLNGPEACALAGAVLFLLLPASTLSGQQIKEMQFVNQPVADILLALGEVSGKSMVPDETVSGSASYRFAQTDFDTALQAFLSAYKMYLRREGEVYYVSRIRTEFDSQTQTISMDAEEVDVHHLLRAASKAMGRTILYDPLPPMPLTVHVARLADFRLESDPSYFYVKRLVTRPSEGSAARAGQTRIERHEEGVHPDRPVAESRRPQDHLRAQPQQVGPGSGGISPEAGSPPRNGPVRRSCAGPAWPAGGCGGCLPWRG